MKLQIALLTATAIIASAPTINAALVTGNPDADGWTSFGNSLADGTYVRGSANYGYNAFGTSFTINSGSSLDISAGVNSWVAGDTVLGGGGVFHTITAADAGWSSFTGNAVNSLLSPTSSLKIQAKFGSSDAAWSLSSIAPGAGDGVGGNPSGGANSTQVRTTGGRSAASYSTGSGSLQTLASSSHIEWANPSLGNSGLSTAVARLIWNFDSDTGMLGSWEILFNASLFDRLYNGNSETPGTSPWTDDLILLTVQNGDAAFTDALVFANASAVAVPEPSTYLAGALLLLPFGASTLRMLRKNRAA